jgi:hypothetical protein
MVDVDGWLMEDLDASSMQHRVLQCGYLHAHDYFHFREHTRQHSLGEFGQC